LRATAETSMRRHKSASLETTRRTVASAACPSRRLHHYLHFFRLALPRHRRPRHRQLRRRHHHHLLHRRQLRRRQLRRRQCHRRQLHLRLHHRRLVRHPLHHLHLIFTTRTGTFRTSTTPTTTYPEVEGKVAVTAAAACLTYTHRTSKISTMMEATASAPTAVCSLRQPRWRPRHFCLLSHPNPTWACWSCGLPTRPASLASVC
jgi:hypothetical protein